MLSRPMLNRTLVQGDTNAKHDWTVFKSPPGATTLRISGKPESTAPSDISFRPYPLCSQNAIKDRRCLGLC